MDKRVEISIVVHCVITGGVEKMRASHRMSLARNERRDAEDGFVIP